MDKQKIKVGIDIDEVIRAKWIQFDRFYVEEFGEEDLPEQPYTQDFFNTYKWSYKTEKVKYLKEDLPEDINPLDYQVDEKTGDAPADSALFKPEETTKLTPKEVFNRFMYEDYVFEIHGSSPLMYKGQEIHNDMFHKKYKDDVDFIILSKENWLSIPSTLFFLGTNRIRMNEYQFVDDFNKYWDHADLIITTNPEVINSKPKNKYHIKLERPYNKNTEKGDLGDQELIHLKDLLVIEDADKTKNIEPQIHKKTEFINLIEKIKNKKNE